MPRSTKTKAPASSARGKLAPPVTALRSSTKSAAIIALLKSKRGATIEEMMGATEWQAHSVRGFLAGSLRKRHGLAATSEKADGQARRYRLR